MVDALQDELDEITQSKEFEKFQEFIEKYQVRVKVIIKFKKEIYKLEYLFIIRIHFFTRIITC